MTSAHFVIMILVTMGAASAVLTLKKISKKRDRLGANKLKLGLETAKLDNHLVDKRQIKDGKTNFITKNPQLDNPVESSHFCTKSPSLYKKESNIGNTAECFQRRSDDDRSFRMSNIERVQTSLCEEISVFAGTEIQNNIDTSLIADTQTIEVKLQERVDWEKLHLALKERLRGSGLRRLKALLRWKEQDPPTLLLSRRGEDVIVLAASADLRFLHYTRGISIKELDDLIERREIKRVVLYTYYRDEEGSAPFAFSFPARYHRTIIKNLKLWISSGTRQDNEPEELTYKEYFEILAWAKQYPGIVDFLASYVVSRLKNNNSHDVTPRTIVPFDVPEKLPSTLPASPRSRSALFIHNSYYHFKYLSTALRDRGWDAMTVALDPPDSISRQFFHGEDLCLYDPDPFVMKEKARDFFRTIPERFSTVHFYGKGYCSLFVENIEDSTNPQAIPWDFLELRRHNVLIGYMPSGCLDGSSQSSIRKLTGGVCSRCVWESRSDICNDAKNLTWAAKLSSICDVVTLEGDHATTERIGSMFVQRPIVTALDPEFWSPHLTIPKEHLLTREKGELIVYHGVGLSKLRRNGDRDIKGTGAVITAIEQLQSEGFPVRLFFATTLQSKDVRYYQLQADVVIDQLNYGRLGANARETLMLGRPLITCLRPQQAPPLPPLQPIEEVPALHATEETIYEVLKELLLDPKRREALGKAGRDFAMKWHAAPVCALRYERMIDRLRAGLSPEADELFS